MTYLEKDPKFYERLMSLSQNVGISPEDLLVVMTLESGINPTIHNSNYGGLVQMSNNTLKGLGYNGDVSQFANEPAYKQLDFVEKQINKLKGWLGKNFETAEQYYLGNLLPVSLKLDGVRNNDESTIIVSKDPKEPHLPNVSIQNEKVYYNSNKGLDLDNDGHITYSDIKNFLNKKRGESHYKHAISQLKSVVNYEPPIKEETKPEIKSDEKYVSKDSNKIFEMIDKLLSKLAIDNSKKKDQMIIKVNSSDQDISVEMSRLLSMALKEDLKLNSLLFKNNNDIEIICKVNSSKIKNVLINEVINNVCDSFNKKIDKLGIKVNVTINNNQTAYEPLLYKEALSSYRKVLVSLNFKG